MSSPIISVNGLGKMYKLGATVSYSTLRDSIVHGFRSLGRRISGNGNFSDRGQRVPDSEFWALKDISFDVNEGEVVGIIGRNGAGKSTLLKILSEITEPTEGEIRIRGRVASLLEVGTGFHPELSGRENIYLNGAILGMTKAEIKRKFDEIVAFAEIEKFLDTPVKRYSSGMYVRLAFAVAAHLEPEILVVDEVLAVGDAQFQKRCLTKMGDVAKGGRTVLFVSHNMNAVQSLCNRAILLDNGRINAEGSTGEVVGTYLSTSFSPTTEQTWDDIETAPGNEEVKLHRVSIRPVNGTPSDTISIRTPLIVEFDYWNLKPGAYLSVALHVHNELGIEVFCTFPVREPKWLGRPHPVGLFRSICQIPGDLMNDGRHYLDLAVAKNMRDLLYAHGHALVFDVQDAIERRTSWPGKWPGAVRPDLQWETELIGP